MKALRKRTLIRISRVNMDMLTLRKRHVHFGVETPTAIISVE